MGANPNRPRRGAALAIRGPAGVVLVAAWGLAAEARDLRTSGYYKNFLSVTDVRDNYRRICLTEQDWAAEDVQRVRLKADATLRDGWDMQVHYEVRWAWGETERIRSRAEEADAPSPIGAPGRDGTRTSFLDLDHVLHDGGASLVSHRLDRLRLRWVGPTLEATVGRQAVSWGVGRIWTPTDLFAGFAPNEIDRDEKPGVDVIRIIWSPSFESAFDLVAEPLDEADAYEVDPNVSSLALRFTGHVGEYDLGALGGRIAGDEVIGGTFSGYLRDAGFRGEFVHTWVREAEERDYTRFLLGLDYGFQARWNPIVNLEYYYNGLGAADEDGYFERFQAASVQRAFARGNAFNLGRQYLGSTLAVTPSALWGLQATTLLNLRDGSVLEFLSATRSLRDNLDLMLGLNAAIGPVGSEFGGFSAEQAGVDFATPDFAFVFLKWYF